MGNRAECKPSQVNTLLETVKAEIRAGGNGKANANQGIPVLYQNGFTYTDTPQAMQAFEAIKNGQSVFLTGVCGSGKTALAIALMNSWFANSMQATEDGDILPFKGVPRFITTQELLLKIKQSWHEKENLRGESEASILDKFSSPPLITLDDIGAEKPSEWARGVLVLLIDRRYRDAKQTIFTSNLGLQELSEKIDDRISSRICEMAIVIDMGKKDWRVYGKRNN